jgi:ABC-type dipeptide/oligopeptide/nickel transport system permease subunit
MTQLDTPALPVIRVPARRRVGIWSRTFRQWTGVIGGTIVVFWIVVAIFAPLIASSGPDTANLYQTLLGPGQHGHLLGTDDLGRDIFSRLIYASRDALIVAGGGALVGSVLGMVLGMIAGYVGGIVDSLVMRLADLMLAYPGLAVGVMVVAVIGPGLWQICVAIAIISFPLFARLGRSEVLRERELDYVAAAQLQGARPNKILLRQILPNTFGSSLVLLGTSMGSAVMTEAALSYVGFGVRPPNPTWGNMLNESLPYLTTEPIFAFSTAIALTSLVLGFNLISDALARASDPFRRQR